MKKIMFWAIFAFMLPLYYLGLIIYFLSKLLKALGYILAMYPRSARAELKDFWTMKYDVSDLF